MTDTQTVVITGITGKQGGATARHLAGKGFTIKGMTRHPDGDAAKALAASGIQIVKGDLDDAASLEQALSGAWGVFAVQNTWEAGVEGEEVQGKRLAEVARKVGVQHYVYTSVGSAHRKTGIPHFENKARIEDTVRVAGLPLDRDSPAGVLHGEPDVALVPERRHDLRRHDAGHDAADDRRR